jgi:hypothetical protein
MQPRIESGPACRLPGPLQWALVVWSCAVRPGHRSAGRNRSEDWHEPGRGSGSDPPRMTAQVTHLGPGVPSILRTTIPPPRRQVRGASVLVRAKGWK